MMLIVYIVCALLLVLLLADRLAPIPMARLCMGLDRWRCGLSVRSCVIDGFQVPYLEGGRGAPLLLIHGFGGDKDNFTRVAKYLTPHYRVIIPDLPGFGDAGRDPAGAYGIADQVARMRALLAQLGIQRVHLGGSSMGGFIAIQLAAEHPELVASVWLLDPLGTAAAYETAIAREYQASGRIPLLLTCERDFPALLSATTSNTPFIPPSLRTALARRAAADFALHTRIMRELSATAPLETRYRDLTTPAYIVWGAEDQILSPAGAAATAQLFSDHRVNLMPKLGHLPMLEAPKRSALDYLAFRRELNARTPT